MNSRVIKPKLPLGTILTAVFFGLLVFGFVVSAVWFSSSDLKEARKTGVIVTKAFEAKPENQISLGRNGGAITASHSEGEYLITVDVPQNDGSKKTYIVDLRDKARFDAVKVGDSFDVGPYLVKD